MSLYKDCGIYGIQNSVDGMTYVGKTKMNFGDRRDSHYSCLRGGYHTNKGLQDAWNKYGEDSFSFIVLESCDQDVCVDEINKLEVEYIKQFREIEKCYNIADGGDESYFKGKHLSEETKRKIGDKNRINSSGRKASSETRKRMSESQKARFANLTEEERMEYSKRMSEQNTGVKWSDEAKRRFSQIQQIKPNGAKYDVSTIRHIRSLHEKDGMTVNEIASLLEMNRGTVYNIVTYRRWKNV